MDRTRRYLFLKGVSVAYPLYSACVCAEGRDDPGYRFAQPFRAAGLHAGGVKELAPVSLKAS